jgi:hypothetical protein
MKPEHSIDSLSATKSAAIVSLYDTFLLVKHSSADDSGGN